MSISSVGSALAQTIRHHAKAPAKKSWLIGMRQPKMARAVMGIPGWRSKPYWVPERNIPGLKRSVQQISERSGVSVTVYRGFASQAKPPKSEDGSKKISPFAKKAIDLIRNRRSEISFIELHSPSVPFTPREIGQILAALAEIRGFWHSLILVPPTELADEGDCTRDPQAADFEEALAKIKMSSSYPSMGFFNVAISSGALIRLLDYAFREGYSMELQLNRH